MGYLVEHYPKFARIVIKAKYDRLFSDPQGRFTVFVPPFWEKYDYVDIEDIDVGEAKRIVMTTTMEGCIRRMDLLTSKDSRLNSLDTSEYIHIWFDERDQQLKKGADDVIGEREVTLSNGIVHNIIAFWI